MKPKKEVFNKIVDVSLPVIFAEMAIESELNPIRDLGNVTGLYGVFKLDNGIIGYHVNVTDMDDKIEHAGKLSIDELTNDLTLYWESVKDVIVNEKVLGYDELLQFISTIRKDFGLLDAMWYMVEYYDKHKLDISEVIKLRKMTEHFVPGLAAVLRKSLQEIFQFDDNTADYLTLNEIFTKEIPDSNEIKRRSHSWYIAGEFYTTINESGLNIEIASEVIDENTTTLKGQSAFPGKVKGIVRIIRDRIDMEEFNDGDIIVSPTTTPDFLPVMKKSTAIISEHGGVICHAAITSRELEIPCIVGVTGATKVLKDGMEIEVDAEEGIITIIK